MAGKRIILSFILTISILSCSSKNSEDERLKQFEVIRITYITWDREFSTLIGADSLQTQEKIKTSKDSSTTEKIIIDSNAVNYLGNFLYDNRKDSVQTTKLDGSYAVKFVLYTEDETLSFFIQYNKSNNFLEKLIYDLKRSRYHKSYGSVLRFLEICDNLDKNGQ